MGSSKLCRELIYLGSLKKDAEKLPGQIKELFVAALKMALDGEKNEDAKPFKYHGSGVFEVVGDHRGNAYREIYTVRYEEVVFVIHVFQKKSKKGAETPKKNKELIEQRLKWTEQIHRGKLWQKKEKPKKSFPRKLNTKLVRGMYFATLDVQILRKLKQN